VDVVEVVVEIELEVGLEVVLDVRVLKEEIVSDVVPVDVVDEP
jgi:hypothetical protein